MTKKKDFNVPGHLKDVDGIQTDDGSIDELYVEKELEIEAGGMITNSGSMSMTGDLTIDTYVLKVDTTNNRVGIGTASPLKSLQVKSSGTGDGIYLEDDSDGAIVAKIKADSAGGNLELYTNGGSPDQTVRLDSTGNSWFNAGNVGIGTASPARKLHINDVMRLEPRSAAPTNPSAGDIYYDSDDNKLKCYNGSSWNDLF